MVIKLELKGRKRKIRKPVELPCRPIMNFEYGENVYEHPTRILGYFRLAKVK